MSDLIPINHKYGLVALEGVVLDESIPDQLTFSPNLIAVRQNPFPLQDHWREWTGSLFAERLERADLYLISRSPTQSAPILDEENKILVRQVHYFYVGLLIANSFSCNSKPIKLTGSNEDGSVGVRQVTELECPRCVQGSDYMRSRLTEEHIKLAASFSGAIKRVYQDKTFGRLKRVLRSFVVGATESYADLRLHQFVRCIEGFILPNAGNTARQMKSRTEVFIGPSHHELIGSIYDVRSKVEHLHDPLVPLSGSSKRDKVAQLLKLSFAVEGITRYLIQHFFSAPHLWEHFVDDEALEKFWAGDAKSIWGAGFDLVGYMREFNEELIPDDIHEDE